MKALGVEAPGAAACPQCGGDVVVPAGEDVFISFSFSDDDFARKLVERLSTSQIRCWFAPESARGGDNLPASIKAALEKAKLVLLLLSSRSAASEWVQLEIGFAFGRKLPIIPVRIEDVPVAGELFHIVNTITEDAFNRPIAEALERIVNLVERKLQLVAGRLERPRTAPAEAAVDPPSALKGVDHAVPDRYVGPRAFEASDLNRFFGRRSEGIRITEELRARSVFVLAPSGAGKSSLINTIVSESLEKNGVRVLKRNVRLRGKVAAEDPARFANLPAALVIWGLSNPVLPGPRQTLAAYLDDTRPEREARRVLVLDQFEEIFTNHDHDTRAAFFADLKVCLTQDKNFRVLFAMRQEYQSNFEAEVESVLDGELQPFKLRLEGFTDAVAREVITRPVAEYVAFAPGVAEEIVKHLRTRRTVDESGREIVMRNETIDLVHLQVVCRRLWSSLPEKTYQVEMHHLQTAGGEDQSFADFVSHAIHAFVEETIEKVAKATGFDKELIVLGLMKFVGAAGTRVTLQMDRDRTGRLRNDVVEGLENEHLLRVETRGAVRWYELSHDLLVEPVLRQRFEGVADMLATLELLTTMLQTARRAHGDDLVGAFESHSELLADSAPFQARKILFSDETEFLFRSSLALGDEATIEAWARRLAQDEKDRYAAVLREALAAPDQSIRAHAATALALVPDVNLGRELVELACDDGSEVVREVAATGIARTDDGAVQAKLLEELRAAPSRARAVQAAAFALTEADRAGNRRFLERYGAVRFGARVRVRLASWRHRLRERAVVPLYVVIPAALLSGIGAGLFKWVPTIFDVGITQPKGSLFMGLYQGFVAGAVWGAIISLALAVHRILTQREGAPASYLRPASVFPFAAASGAASGFAVTMVILSVYQMHSLLDMKWIDSETKFPRFHEEFFRQVFFKSRFGWAFVISGTFLAVGIALTANALVASKGWKAFLARQTTQVASLRQTRDILKEITGLALPRAWPILLLQLIAAPLAAAVQQPQDPAVNAESLYLPALTQDECAALPPEDEKTRDHLSLCLHLSESDRVVRHEGVYWNWWGTFAESGCQVTGGFGVVVGMAFGIVLTTQGMNIKPAVRRAKRREAA